jgi:hypothetical protein
MSEDRTTELAKQAANLLDSSITSLFETRGGLFRLLFKRSEREAVKSELYEAMKITDELRGLFNE